MLLITVDRLIRIPISGLNPLILLELKRLGTHEDPVWKRDKTSGKVVDDENRYMFSWDYSADGSSIFLSRGLYDKIVEILQKYSTEFSIVDNRTSIFGFKVDLKSSIKLLEYQKRAIDSIVLKESGIVFSPCGSGKTVIGFGIIAKIKQPTLIVVNTMEIMKQWVDGAKSSLDLYGKRSIGQIGGGKHSLKDITVATHQSLNNLDRDEWIKINKKFGCLIFDECDISAAPTLLATLNNSKAKYRYGVSASIKRKDRREFLVFDSISHRIVEVDDHELEKEGRSVSADVEFSIYRSSIKVPMYRFMGSDNELVEDVNWGELYNRLASDSGRNDLIIKKIVESVKMGHRVLILSTRVEHCNFLFKKLKELNISSAVLVGSINKQLRKDIIKKARDGQVDALVATNSLAYRGLDIPILSSLHLTMPTANPEFLKQATGRIRRVYEGKIKPLVVDTVDTFFPTVIGMAKSRSRIYSNLGYRILNRDILYSLGEKAS